jgi:hypothetical protein
MATTMELFQHGKDFMKVNLNPKVTKEEKQELLTVLLSKLSSNAINELAPTLIMQTKFGHKRFDNSELELEFYLNKYPQMSSFRDMILLKINEDRKMANLKI